MSGQAPRRAALRAAFYTALCMSIAFAARTHADVPGPIKVGVFHNEAAQYDQEWRTDWGFGRHLKPDGFDCALIEENRLYRGGATADQIVKAMKRFDVVIWATAYEGSYHLTPALQQTAKVAREALEHYVRDGGGLFIVAEGVRYPGDDDEKYNNLLLEGFGARMMHEGIFDKTQTYLVPPSLILPQRQFFYTDNVKPHPITEGVRRVYLRTTRGDEAGVEAIQYSPDWKIVLAGGTNAKSYSVGYDNRVDFNREATYKSSPPIAALRSFGKGRIFVYATPVRNLFLNYNNPLWANISESVGDEKSGHPSDSMKMAENALRWLAEPARQTPGFGTYVAPPYKPVNYPTSVEWDSARFSSPSAGVRGLIGAHSNYTDGSGTVADYAKAAKTARLSFVIFTDPLEMLTAEKLTALKSDCAAASSDSFYACPGVEFTDSLGVRWVTFGEKTIYPAATFENGGHTFTQWDGKVLHLTGCYECDNTYGPNGIIGMDALRKAGASPANLWWFFRSFPFIYDGDRLIADDFKDYLYSQRDLRLLTLASYTRVRNPSQVADAANACCTVINDMRYVRDWCNSRCENYHSAGTSYVTQGPRILLWQAINSQMEEPWQITRGAQRVRCKFVVSSDAGIRNVKVHDADFGIVRRFDGHGATELTREFEMVQDKQHYLSLEVTGTNGRRAISNFWFLYCYKSGLYRCGDNLNFLGSAAVILHPDRHQRLMFNKTFEDVNRIAVQGYDTGSGMAPQPEIFPMQFLQTKDGLYPPRDGPMVGSVLDVPMASTDVSIASMDMGTLADRFDTPQRPTPAMGPILRHLGPREYLENRETAYILNSRMNYFTAWNHRRTFEGSKNYRGGLIWHEGYFKVRRDVQLKPGLSLPLFAMQARGGAKFDQWDHLFVDDLKRGPMAWQVTVDGKAPTDVYGQVKPGGYLAAMPTTVGYFGFLPGTGSVFNYDAGHWAQTRGDNGRIYVGFAPKGSELKAGTVIPYRFLIATINDHTVSADLLQDIAKAYNLDGGTSGYPFHMKVGKFVNAEFFFTVDADRGETAFDIGPRKMICDLAFRFHGIEDNGCAAVYVEGRKFFRFIAVSDGIAYFQEPIDNGASIWAGNVFVCDHKDVKLTLVRQGLAEGATPFLEVHNPGTAAITAHIWSPPHTPIYGGRKITIQVPEGDSVKVTLGKDSG